MNGTGKIIGEMPINKIFILIQIEHSDGKGQQKFSFTSLEQWNTANPVILAVDRAPWKL